MIDDTPDLDTVSNLSSNLFSPLTSQINLNDQLKADDLESLQYDGLEHLAGYICHKIKNPNLVVDSAVINTNKDS